MSRATATSARVSFAEVLSSHKQHLTGNACRLDLSRYLDHVPDAAEGVRLIQQEWQAADHMAPYTLPASGPTNDASTGSKETRSGSRDERILTR